MTAVKFAPFAGGPGHGPMTVDSIGAGARPAKLGMAAVIAACEPVRRAKPA